MPLEMLLAIALTGPNPTLIQGARLAQQNLIQQNSALQNSAQQSIPVQRTIPASPNSFVPVTTTQFNGLIQDDLGDRASLIQAIDHSLQFINRPSAVRRFPVSNISHGRVRASLIRFRELLVQTRTAAELQQALSREFTLYRVPQEVLFTGYYEPVFRGSRRRTPVYRFPLFRLPPDLQSWRSPHPTRAELENGPHLRGLELAWLSDPFEAFLIHVQGSARLDLGNGEVMTVGYAGKTEHPYTSIGRELVRDGKMRLGEVTLQSIQAFFRKHPQKLIPYLHRNHSFIFFRETYGAPATGSLGVPVTAERSIATDRSLMPHGAIAVIRTELPFPDGRGNFRNRPVTRFVLDQDAGSAIRGLGRVDVFMGTGQMAQERAGLMANKGELFYLLLRE